MQLNHIYLSTHRGTSIDNIGSKAWKGRELVFLATAYLYRFPQCLAVPEPQGALILVDERISEGSETKLQY